MLKVLDFEALDDPEPTYRFTVEAVDEEGVMPPGLTSVTVTIKVGVWKHFFNVFYIAFYHHLFIFIIFIFKKILFLLKAVFLALCLQSTAKNFAFASFASRQRAETVATPSATSLAEVSMPSVMSHM